MMKCESKITQREKEILELVAKNYSNTEIARQLFISVSTVKSHISTIFEKLNANGRIQATLFAVKMGIIDLD